ncbi:hypothetical protein [Actinokineospora sp. NBRC 105648]|uniref:hypothetical protein n=1 Tax=Actinokineospora sp. NBRC 105648 TaxID=3032206 RepID=UPI0024A59E4E|nr:hypothetical protein [Actinokineospora sp. NBRC 105648]GLZ36580.1 hypothetical protein Acsp05_02050 [Actinokineospora sp. NBRC 105648]
MANASLGIADKSALLALMLIVDEAANPEIRERFGFPIDKPVRERLVGAGMITARKDPGRRNAIVHELTETGWKGARAALAEDVPPGAHKAYRLLYAVNQALKSTMDRFDLAMADVFQLPTDQTEQPERTEHVEPVEDPGAAERAGVDARVLAAYTDLAGEPGAYVSLTRLRGALAGFPRAEVDAALTRLAARPETFLIPEINQKTLTSEDRAAALFLGGEDKHLLSIER